MPQVRPITSAPLVAEPNTTTHGPVIHNNADGRLYLGPATNARAGLFLPAEKAALASLATMVPAGGYLSRAEAVGDLVGSVRARDFGITGLVDETAQIRAMHEYANLHQLPVSYAGLPEIFVQADAQIPINTSVDFAGVPISILEGVRVPLAGSVDRTFMVIDPDCPLTTMTGLIDNPAVSLALGSRRPTAGLWEGTGYAFVEFLGRALPSRNADGNLLTLCIPFELHEGLAIQPVPENLTDAPNVLIRYRQSPRRRVVIRNIHLMDDGWNALNFMIVYRNKVEIDGVTVETTQHRATGSRDRLFRWWHSADLVMRNFRVMGRPYSVTGVYAISFNGVASMAMENVVGNELPGSWGVTGSNYVNDCRLDRCTLDRFDVHAGLFNFWTAHSTFTGRGIACGTGGGKIGGVGNTAINAPLFQVRGDYGKYFSNARIEFRESTWYVGNLNLNRPFVDIGSTNIRSFGGEVAMACPDLVIDGLDIIPMHSAPQTVSVLELSVRADVVPVTAPQYLDTRNIRVRRGEAALDVALRVNFAGFAARPGGAVATWDACTIRSAGHAPALARDAGLVALAPQPGAPVAGAQWAVNIADLSGMGIDFAASSPAQITLDRVSIPWLQVPDAVPVAITATNVTLIPAADSPALPRFGGAFISDAQSTRVFGLHRTADDIPRDFSHLGATVGLTARPADLLPVGLDAAVAFTGWARPD